MARNPDYPLTTSDVAELVSVTAAKINRWRSLGLIPDSICKSINGRWHYKHEAVDWSKLAKKLLASFNVTEERYGAFVRCVVEKLGGNTPTTYTLLEASYAAATSYEEFERRVNLGLPSPCGANGGNGAVAQAQTLLATTP